MKGKWVKLALTGAFLALLAGCSSRPTDRGQQYKDGKLDQPFALVNQPNAKGSPVNARDFAEQVRQIQGASGALFNRNSSTYTAIESWLVAGGIPASCVSLVSMPGRWRGPMIMGTSSSPATTPR
ncbi:Membrane-bound lytic murein transglycosylase A precursor [Tatumella ptyseos]|uniref:Membrane-bound lytic murein transglycosylase A n=1 Tax=Tatumella ptyseos TaxID=82987 RepID=A0A2X5NGP7_9GAMM|nr:Membrane-bound lytic murein transglycosylase A precursor [Tatumella ptyseos]